MSRAANSSAGEQGAGWYLPPYGEDGIWPGTWLRDLDAELETRGCDQTGRDSLIMGGSTAAWSSDSSTFDFYTWQGTIGAAERLWVGSPSDPERRLQAFNVTQALPRLAVHVCRMKGRGAHGHRRVQTSVCSWLRLRVFCAAQASAWRNTSPRPKL